MTSMMNTIGWNFGISVLFGLHILSVIAFVVGLIFFVVIAIRTFSNAKLKTSAIWLMVAGVIICLFTIAASPLKRPWSYAGSCGFMSGKMGMMEKMESMMNKMTEHDEKSPSDDHEEMEDMLVEMMGNK